MPHPLIVPPRYLLVWQLAVYRFVSALGACRRRAGRGAGGGKTAAVGELARQTFGFQAYGAPQHGLVDRRRYRLCLWVSPNGLSQLSKQLTDTHACNDGAQNIPHSLLIPLVIPVVTASMISAKKTVPGRARRGFFPDSISIRLHGIERRSAMSENGADLRKADGDLFRRVIFPVALPSIFAACASALGIMWD